MHDPDRMRALERAVVLASALIAAATIYALTGDGGMAAGIAVAAVLIVMVLLRLERLADRLFVLAFRLLTLPFRLLRRTLGG